MITSILINTAGAAVTEGSGTINNDNESETDFSQALSLASNEDSVITKTTASAAPDETDTEETEKSDGTWDLLLEQLYQLADFVGQQADMQIEEDIASKLSNIIGVLEGNGVSGDMDIAAQLAEVQGCIQRLGSEEKEAIMARMPQLAELFQQADAAATEGELQFCSNLCPLENTSEPQEAPLAAMQDAKALADEAPEEQYGVEAVLIEASNASRAAETDSFEAADAAKTDAADTAEAETAGVTSRQPEAQAAQQEQGGSAEPDDGTKDYRTEAGQADEAVKITDGGLTDSEGSAVAAWNNADGTQPNDVIKMAADNALSKLSDILSSYDEPVSDQFEIQLEPENLGKLSITLSMGNEGLRALIRTSDTQVQSLLSSEINALADKLSENGVEIKSLDVICTDMGGGQLDSKNPGNSFYGQQAASYGSKRPEDVQTAYEESNITHIALAADALLGSTVSYRA